MLSTFSTRKYEKSLQKYLKIKKFSISKLESVIIKLQNRIPLDEQYKDHQMKG